jgi:hypothetical protein
MFEVKPVTAKPAWRTSRCPKSVRCSSSAIELLLISARKERSGNDPAMIS